MLMEKPNTVYPKDGHLFVKDTNNRLTNLVLSPLLFVLVFLFVLFSVLLQAAIAVLRLLFVSVFLLRVFLMFAAAQKQRRSKSECKGSDTVQWHKRHHQQRIILSFLAYNSGILDRRRYLGQSRGSVAYNYLYQTKENHSKSSTRFQITNTLQM